MFATLFALVSGSDPPFVISPSSLLPSDERMSGSERRGRALEWPLVGPPGRQGTSRLAPGACPKPGVDPAADTVTKGRRLDASGPSELLIHASLPPIPTAFEPVNEVAVQPQGHRLLRIIGLWSTTAYELGTLIGISLFKPSIVQLRPYVIRFGHAVRDIFVFLSHWLSTSL